MPVDGRSIPLQASERNREMYERLARLRAGEGLRVRAAVAGEAGRPLVAGMRSWLTAERRRRVRQAAEAGLYLDPAEADELAGIAYRAERQAGWWWLVATRPGRLVAESFVDTGGGAG